MTKDPFLALVEAVYKKGGKQALMDPKMIHLAVRLGRLDLLRLLLEHGANPNARDRRTRTPLFFARDERIVHTLVKAGARVADRDLAHHQPLHAAVRAGRLDVAKALLQLGADLSAQDKRGLTPLHQAAMRGRVKCLRHLVEQGAWVNGRDRHGRSPLFYAVAGGHLDAALVLIDEGADLVMVDDHGTPWLHLARLDQVAQLQAAADRALGDQAYEEWHPGQGEGGLQEAVEELGQVVEARMQVRRSDLGMWR